MKPTRPRPITISLLLAGLLGYGAGAPVASADEVIIEEEAPSPAGEEIVIDTGAGGGEEAAPGEMGGEELLIGDEGADASMPIPGQEPESNLHFTLDDVRLEYGYQARSASAAVRQLYGKLAATVDWRPQPRWEVRLSGRLDGYDQDGRLDWSEVRADYGDSFVRYRGDGVRLTLGAQTVIWGRLDEVPLSDRVSTVDFTRLLLDKLQDRRRATPMLRAETNIGEGRLDLVWLYRFRGAELPDRDSVWYPIDRLKGRILGLKQGDIPPALVKTAAIREHEPNGDGGFGLRYTASPFFGDIGITVARTRRSLPYYRVAGGGSFETVYPRSWALGADTAVDAMGATWRAEVVYSSDNPVTRRDGAFTYTTTEGIEWGFGVEMHPGDGDSRVNLQLVGANLIAAPAVLDRTESYNLNGEIEIPFDRERWKASLDFNIGLDRKDLFLNPEIAFLGWEPHEFYLALNWFDGDEETLGGFYHDQSSINLGWRAKF